MFSILGVVSLNEDVPRGNCTASKGKEVISLLALAEIAGLSTGVVTTARLTHASPSTAYSHSADRNWECDHHITDTNCKDIGKNIFYFLIPVILFIL